VRTGNGKCGSFDYALRASLRMTLFREGWRENRQLQMRVLRLRAAPRFAQDDTFLGRGGGRTGNGKCNGEMRGSLHCATDGETVCCFGRDDALFCFWRYRTRSNRGFLRCAAARIPPLRCGNDKQKNRQLQRQIVGWGSVCFHRNAFGDFFKLLWPTEASKGVPLAVVILLVREEPFAMRKDDKRKNLKENLDGSQRNRSLARHN